VALTSAQLYELFLALAPARIAAARSALELEDVSARATELASALVPLAVDAALLGADGVSALASAVSASPEAPLDQLRGAVEQLERAAEQLSQGDASGARTDESALLELAGALREGTQSAAEPEPAAAPPRAPTPPPARPAAPPPASSTAKAPAPPVRLEPEPPDEVHWVPQLADDMIEAFLDECVERTDGLSERLLALEEQGANPELVGEIFRDLHTLKGSSAFAGLKKMNRVAHRAEDLIGELRDGRRQCTRSLIDVLLETLDVLRALLDRARRREPIDLDVRDLLHRLADPNAAPAAVPSAPAIREPQVPGSAPKPQRAAAAPQATLRIDFAKVDLLLNLVGEIVLARGRLHATAEAQAGLVREVAALRKKLAAQAKVGGNGAASPTRARAALDLVEDLQRTERVFHESYAELDSGLGSLGLAVGQLRDNVMKLRMVPIARLFTKYQRTVRELSNKLGKEVAVELSGAETELDKVLVERLEDPLLHLVRNSVDHGVELPEQREAAGKPRRGSIRLAASQRGGQVIVAIEDDGAGMDAEKLRAKAIEKGLLDPRRAESMTDADSYELIFAAGFSTAATVSDVSGRGVGMDVVRDTISKLKGSIHIDSELGRGTRMELRLPLTLAITQVLVARVGAERVAIPLDAVVSAQTLDSQALSPVADGVCLRLGEELIPVLDLAALLGLADDVGLEDRPEAAVVIVEVGPERLGLMVQRVMGRHEVVIKSLGPLLAGAPCAAGATLIGNRVLLVVDLAAVARRARQASAKRVVVERTQEPVARKARILLAEDSEVVRETMRRELAAAGYDVRAASDGEEALRLALREQFDAVSTDVMMPRVDGYQLTRALRADPRYQHVPIVMVTSKDARIDSMRGYDAGADAYLTKPSDVAALIRTLEDLLARRRGEEDGPR